MNQKLKKILGIALMCVGLIAGLVVLRQALDKRSGSESYASAQQLAFQTTPATEAASTLPPETVPPATQEPSPSQEPQATEALRPVWVPAPLGEDPNLAVLQTLDLEALQAVNPDVLGWIYIPDSQINYPLLQGTDNQYYLDHTWDHLAYVVGSIFLECKNSNTFTDFNTIVYGHNMNDGSMFAQLHQFKKQEFFDSHPYVYIVLPERILRYEVFAAFDAPVDSPVYGLSFRQEQTKIDLLSFIQEQTVVTSAITPELTDRILTLSTCSGFGYQKRSVVLARLPMVLEYR